MNAFETFTAPMYEALRKIGEGHVTARDIGGSIATLTALRDRGFVEVEYTSHAAYYMPTPMGLGAIAVLNAPVTPKDGEGSISRIQRVVAHYYSIPALEMVSARRARTIARPRQIAMYLCRKLTTHSLPTIGHFFGGRDHTTVIHACKTIEAIRRDDRSMDSDIQDLLRTLDPEDDYLPNPIDRTPCFKCGVRADIGCVHTRVAA